MGNPTTLPARTPRNSKSFAKKKAALTLLRIFRKHPDVFQAEDWAPRIVALMDEIDLRRVFLVSALPSAPCSLPARGLYQGVAQAVTTLVLAASQQYPDSYKDCVPKAIECKRCGHGQPFMCAFHFSKTLNYTFDGQIVIDREYSPDYVYYKVPVPWFQCKLLRLLHYYPPSEDRNLRSWLNEVLKQVIGTTQEMPKNVQHNNAQNAVLFEAISLAIHLDPESDIVKEAAVLLGRFIASKETNIRYLALDAMARLAAFSESLEPIKKHQETIIQSLRDRDISVRRRGLDL
ncbi:MAG: LOW QUALITY PROTEIN: Clathrin/coatomer adaptor, adaptin-like protein, partial [Olpidium bornovanus]